LHIDRLLLLFLSKPDYSVFFSITGDRAVLKGVNHVTG